MIVLRQWAHSLRKDGLKTRERSKEERQKEREEKRQTKASLPSLTFFGTFLQRVDLSHHLSHSWQMKSGIPGVSPNSADSVESATNPIFTSETLETLEISWWTDGHYYLVGLDGKTSTWQAKATSVKKDSAQKKDPGIKMIRLEGKPPHFHDIAVKIIINYVHTRC